MKRRPSRKTRLYPQVRHFTCTVCGVSSPATKWRGHTHPGHIKTMYCFRCRRDTDHIQTD